MQDGLRFLDQSQPERAKRKARDQIAQHRTQTDLAENRHPDHACTQECSDMPQTHAGSFCGHATLA